ncbi:MAG TPA: ribonuclease J [Allosphingosinicella sp.]|nr:ribonuclease J [Allosphingosinicella sp.]
MKPGKELLFLALGGSGEIGMNVNLYGCDGKWLMVDLGMTFADADYPGVELVLPDLTFIEKQRKNLMGIVITHGHEDHIGAIPYLAADLGVPLYATPFTAGLIAEKLKEEGLEREVKVKLIDIGGTANLGPFSIRFVPLAHSIPEGNALLISTPYGNVFHTGDWKLDEFPQIGDPADAAALTRVGDEGILALVCDSTNVFQEEASGSEEEVRKGLDQVVEEAEGRVLVTTFASNAARVSTLGKVAQDTGRKVCVAGRSLDRILRVARSVGYLTDFPETIDFETAMNLPRKEVLIIATGGQGESRAALARVAFKQHKIALTEGDLVVFSSKQIPGNEIAIGRIQNELAERGVRMITDRQANVHVSGHPGRPELAAMYRWTRPEIIVPVHGEMRHLAEHDRFARSCGVPRGIVQQNGDLIRLAPDGPVKLSQERVGQLILDGDVILPADGTTMNERRRISFQGVISVAVAMDDNDRVRGGVEISLQGVPVEEDREAFLEEACAAVTGAAKKGAKDENKLKEAIRLAVRRCASEWTGKKPVVDVLLVRV